MKKHLSIILICLTSVSFAQLEWLNKPSFVVDSAGYWAKHDPNGTRTSAWIKADLIENSIIEKYHRFKKGNSWGLADENFKVVVPARNKNIYAVNQNIFMESYGSLSILNNVLDTIKFIDKIKRIEFDRNVRGDWNRYQKGSGNFSKRMIISTYEGTGVMDNNLEWIVKPNYDNAFFYNGLIFLRKGDQFGFIDQNEKIIDAEYNSIAWFNEYVLELEQKSGKTKYITTKGEVFPQSDSVLVYDQQYHMYKIYQNGKGELYNSKAEKVLSYKGDDIFAIGYIRNNSYATNIRGKTSKNPVVFAVNRNDKIGALDSNGNTVIQAKFDHLQVSGEHLIAMENGRFGVIDLKGNYIIEPTYTYIEGNGEYFKLYKGTKKGFANTKGEVVLPVEFNFVSYTNSGFHTKMTNSGEGFYDYEGNVILENIYDYSSWTSNGLKFYKNDKVCYVSDQKLMTPLDCDQIDVTNNKMKFYHHGNIYICNFDENGIIDTTVYPRKQTLRIGREGGVNKIRLGGNVNHLFWDQVSSKIGSINKYSANFSIEPQYSSVFSNGHTEYVKKQHYESLQSVNGFMEIKESMQIFAPNSGAVSHDMLSYSSERNTSTWSDSYYNASINMDRENEFYYQNALHTETAPFIMRRYGVGTAVLTEGNLNTSEGQPLIRFREYFEDLNFGCNFKITNKFQFDRLATNEIIYVQDPKWKSVIFPDVGHRSPIVYNNCSHYEEVDYDVLVVADRYKGYFIYDGEGENILKTKAGQVIVDKRDGFTYFLVQEMRDDLGGSTQLSWTIYNKYGRVLKESYEAVEVLQYGVFKVKKDGKYYIVNDKENVMYQYGDTNIEASNR
ncbi:WG repeat-containing protein [Paracrocinitomix mangrovi]|uniref:WG repeat-containing protein n=1 Tax=Paracrocinitomix mangrovi TaxID=2862509 RepID=UPI001C8CFD82|nr:WG repeat-containing protein [Paracrocinitomix mangrovi]UKN03499.1 WG repeat-containing protein [Paracrocinitomix mangrovi]